MVEALVAEAEKLVNEGVEARLAAADQRGRGRGRGRPGRPARPAGRRRQQQQHPGRADRQTPRPTSDDPASRQTSPALSSAGSPTRLPATLAGMAWDVHQVVESEVPAFARSRLRRLRRGRRRGQPGSGRRGLRARLRPRPSPTRAGCVATASAYPLEMTLPAGPGHELPGDPRPRRDRGRRRSRPTAGRGCCTTLMDHQLADFRQRGYAMAAPAGVGVDHLRPLRLRLGPVATSRWLIESDRDAFRPDAARDLGSLRLLDADEAGKVLPDAARPGPAAPTRRDQPQPLVGTPPDGPREGPRRRGRPDLRAPRIGRR